MSFFQDIFTGIALFVGSLFGFTHPILTPIVPVAQVATSTVQSTSTTTATQNLASNGSQVSWIPVATDTYEYLIQDNQIYFSSGFGFGPVPNTDTSTFELEKDPYHPDLHPYAREGAFVYCDGSKLDGADPKMFTVLFTVYSKISGDYQLRYAKDENHVYANCGIVSGADPATFAPILDDNGRFTGYSKDANNIYFASPLYLGLGVVSTSSFFPNIGSFWVLSGYAVDDMDVGPHYATDGTRVYIDGNVLDQADPKSFVVIQNHPSIDAQDKNNIYWNGEKASTRYSCFIRSDSHVSVINAKGSSAVSGADYATFVPFDIYEASPQGGDCYGKDASHAYWSDWQGVGIISGADPVTFTTDSTIYPFAKDKSHVFLLNDPLPGADPGTFHVIDVYDHAVDKNNVYYFGIEIRGYVSVIQGADPNTFSLVPVPAGDASVYGTDNNHVYCFNNVLSGADVGTFHDISNGEYADKNHTYDSWCRTL